MDMLLVEMFSVMAVAFFGFAAAAVTDWVVLVMGIVLVLGLGTVFVILWRERNRKQ